MAKGPRPSLGRGERIIEVEKKLLRLESQVLTMGQEISKALNYLAQASAQSLQVTVARLTELERHTGLSSQDENVDAMPPSLEDILDAAKDSVDSTDTVEVQKKGAVEESTEGK